MRVTGWEEILDTKLVEARLRAFEWGAFDCCRFAAEVVDAITGSEHLADLSTRYADERGALRFMKRKGGLRKAVTGYLGEPVEKWALARRGDVCLIPTEGGEGLGICTGATIAGVDVVGIGFYALDKALAVWRVD